MKAQRFSNAPRVLAVTTSMGTKWESYSQALLNCCVPEWRRQIVDGRKNWTPTGFIERVVDEDVDFIVHVDEDCFVTDRSALLDVICAMTRDSQIVAAVIPDGGYYYRDHNPAALNLFFVVFRANALRAAWARREEWQKLTFRDEYGADVLLQRPDLDLNQIQWDEAEPYYPLFWYLLAQGGRFLYLKQDIFQSRWSTRIFSPSGVIVCEHLWYLRQWFSQDTMPGHDCANINRYTSFRDDLFENQWRASRLRLRLALMKADFARYGWRLGVARG